MKNTNIDLLLKFITDNKLGFDDSGSALNSNCVIICGYALYIGGNLEYIFESLRHLEYILTVDLITELERVYNYAEKNMYEKFWDTEAATKQYVF